MTFTLVLLFLVLSASTAAASRYRGFERNVFPVLFQGKFALVAVEIDDNSRQETRLLPCLYSFHESGIRFTDLVFSDYTVINTDNPDIPIGDEPPPDN